MKNSQQQEHPPYSTPSSCYGQNTNGTNSVSENYGVFYCSKGCGKNHSLLVSAENRKLGAFLQHPRIATRRGRRITRGPDLRLVWIRHTFTTGGEPYGPIVTMEHLNNIVELQKIEGDEETIAKLNTILQTVDAEKNPHGTKDAQSIVDAYESCVQDAKDRQKEIEDLKKETNEATNNLREQKTRAWVDVLLTELGDVPWKEAVSTFSFQKKRGSTKSLAKFTCPLVQDKLQELAAAPSKATKKKLKALAKELSIPFNKHYAHDLIGYLDDNDSFQKLLKTRLEAEKTDGRLPANMFMRFTKKAVEMMDAEQWVEVWDVLRFRAVEETAVDYVMSKVRERFPDATEDELRGWRPSAGYHWTPRFYILWRSHGNHENQDNGPFAERMPKFERDVVEMVEHHRELARKDQEALQRFREKSNP